MMNDEAKALCERLRERDWGTNVADTLTRWDQACIEAADMIERLSAENEALCAALAETTYDDSDAFEAATGCATSA